VDVEHYRRRLLQLERQLADALGDELETARAMADRLSRSVPNLCRERRRPQHQRQMEERDDLGRAESAGNVRRQQPARRGGSRQEVVSSA